MIPKKETILSDVRRALEEDVGAGDITASLLPASLRVKAEIMTREPMLVCGRSWVELVFSEIDPDIELTWLVEEGAWLECPMTLCKIQGSARSILTAERTALNFMQTLSGTATETYHYVRALKGFHTRLLDTRKTLPGLRLAQKYAVACAGGVNHRLGLYDAFLIKENHIKAAGSIKAAIQRARLASVSLGKDGCKPPLLEVEVETLEELREALDEDPDRILLDNFNLQMLVAAVAMNAPKRCELEASGGVDLATITKIAETGIDYVSVGLITKSVKAIDLSLLIRDLE